MITFLDETQRFRFLLIFGILIFLIMAFLVNGQFFVESYLLALGWVYAKGIQGLICSR